MASVTYLNTDGEITRYGGRENHTSVFQFFDRSACRMVYAVGASQGFGFDVGSTRRLGLTATGIDFSGTLLAEDTDAGGTANPLDLYSNSASPADNDELQVRHFFKDSACAKVEFARHTTVMVDETACSKDASLRWDVMVGDVLLNDFLKFGASAVGGCAEFIINEDGDDVDFRVEGANNANLVVSDGATDSLGFGSAVVAGAFATWISSAQTRNVATGVGTSFNFPLDTHTCGLGSATVAVVADHFYGIKTYNGGAAMTYTNLSTVMIDGPPVANTCVTGTTIASLYIRSGNLVLGAVGGVGATIDFHGTTDSITKFAPGASPACVTYKWPQTVPGCCAEQLSSDTGGTMDWTVNTSMAETKDIHGITCPQVAYDRIKNANIYDFDYKDEWKKRVLGGRSIHPFVGLTGDENPWAMMGLKNRTFSAISAFGTLTSAFQVLAAKVEALSTP